MRLLTVVEAAEVLAVSKSLVYALIQRGELPHVRVGTSKGIRIDEADLEAFVAERRSSPLSPAPRRKRRTLKHVRL